MVNIVAHFAPSAQRRCASCQYPSKYKAKRAHNQKITDRKGLPMLYKFKSKTTGDLIMLEPHGRWVLEIIGKTPAAQGIVQVAQMPAAIAKLEAAMAQEQAEHEQATDADTDDSGHADQDTSLSLRRRAAPFVDLLKRCSQDGSDLVWGV
jgi:hypothetical protein